MNYLTKAGLESFVGNLAGNRITKYALTNPKRVSCLIEFNKNDHIFLPLLPIILSLIFKPLRSVTGFHGGLAFVIACISTYRNYTIPEQKNDDTKNNKPQDDDKSSLKVKQKLDELAKKQEKISSQDTPPVNVGEAVKRELAKHNKNNNILQENNKAKNKGNKKVSFSQQVATVRTFQIPQGNRLKPIKKRR